MSYQTLHPVPSNVLAWYNEKCYFEYLSRHKWRKYANLGSVLDAQLVFQGQVTRCTQTNWKWRQMAERWRHAKVIEATDVIYADELNERLRQELHVLRKVTGTDKITDTMDLEYDPYDMSMNYTRRSSRMASRGLLPKDQLLAMRFVGLWKNFVMHKKTTRKSRNTTKSGGSYGESDKKLSEARKRSDRSSSRPKSRLAKSGDEK